LAEPVNRGAAANVVDDGPVEPLSGLLPSVVVEPVVAAPGEGWTRVDMDRDGEGERVGDEVVDVIGATVAMLAVELAEREPWAEEVLEGTTAGDCDEIDCEEAGIAVVLPAEEVLLTAVADKVTDP
jgi:hypothetical protein